MNKEEQIKEMARALCGYSYNAETGYCNKSDEETGLGIIIGGLHVIGGFKIEK